MKFPDPPRGAKAIPWRLPIWFYRAGLGWLLGNRMLLLSHTGRKSGKIRQNVLEVIDSTTDKQSYTVVSGFGPKSDWYQNISLNPDVELQVGMEKYRATAYHLDLDESEKVFLDYVNKFPRVFRSLANLIGYEIDHTPEGYREFARQIPIIKFAIKDPRKTNHMLKEE